MSIKIEPRGKYSGVKVHLDPDEIQVILSWKDFEGTHPLLRKLGNKIAELQEIEPTLLDERTPEQIAAILAKESEKAALQLKALQSGAEWKKVDPDALNAAMSKLVNKQ